MTVEANIYWDDELDDVIVAELSGAGSWDDYHRLHDQVLEAIHNSGRQAVDFIFVLKTKVPPGSPISHMKRTSSRWRNSPQARDYVLVVPERHVASLANVLINVVRQITAKQNTQASYKTYASFAQARNHIAQSRHQAPTAGLLDAD